MNDSRTPPEAAATTALAVLDSSRLRDVIGAWHEGMQILSPQWRYLYINETAAAHGRRSRAELIGRTLTDCYPGVTTTAMFRTLEQCMLQRTSASMLNEFEYPDGRRATFELRIQPCPEGLIILSLERRAPSPSP